MRTLALIWLVAHASSPEDKLPGPAWDGKSYRVYADAASGLSLEAPLTEERIEFRHFDPKGPVGEAKHIVTLHGPNGAEVTVDVWDTGVPIEAGHFFETYLPFLRAPNVGIATVLVPGPNVAGLLFTQPRGQAFARRTVVFAQGNRVVRLTCLNDEDERTRLVFERALATVKLGGAP
ncbi:MAG: hypothetical protein QM723_23385 [Myxococcaceae bacterium]